MAKIRVRCPACKTELEVDSEHIGTHVECGRCLEPFVAEPPATSRLPGTSSPSSKSSRGQKSSNSQAARTRRDDEDDDYEHDHRRRDDDDDDDDYSPPRRRRDAGTGLALASLFMGIFAVFPGCCCGLLSVPLSLAAIVTGSIALRNPNGKPMAIIGIILGGCMIGFTILGLVFNFGIGLNNGRFR